jgi:DNA invertase Pin-like site-specific DNA recombinase
VAEHKRDAISARTKAALVAAKANGKKLGNYRRIAEAKERPTTARPEAAIAETAHLSTRAAAEALNRPRDRKRRAMTRDADSRRPPALGLC